MKGQPVEPVKHLSFQHVNGFKSGLKYYYKQLNIPIPADVDATLHEFIGGYERTVAELKLTGEMEMTEGKQPLDYKGYKYLASRAMKATEDTDLNVFAHCFLVFCWNLIARCNSVSSLMFEHISWEADALIVVFPSHKGDKEGKNCSPKHVYANRENPEICPILSLAIYVFTLPHRRNEAKKMVFCDVPKDTNSKFSKC